MPSVACCPACHRDRRGPVPLVVTFAFSGKEFYCLECGGRFGWLEPRGEEESPELLAAMGAAREEWEALGGGDLIGGGVMRRTCPRCCDPDAPPGKRLEAHELHATREDVEAHEAALARLAARAATR